jgi:hypothetical protein
MFCSRHQMWRIHVNIHLDPKFKYTSFCNLDTNVLYTTKKIDYDVWNKQYEFVEEVLLLVLEPPFFRRTASHAYHGTDPR